MSVGRGNRKTKKIHALRNDRIRATLCGLPISRRYVRSGNESDAWAVNCDDCLRALVDACTYPEFLRRAGFAKAGPHGLPVKHCERCGEWDEFTSESDAHGICATCMAYANRPETP